MGTETSVRLLHGCLSETILLLWARHMLAIVLVLGMNLALIGILSPRRSYVYSSLTGRKLVPLAIPVVATGRRGGRLSTEVSTVC